ncbi:E3 ubiquitin-protein ligase TRIM21-like isoform X2 [Neoarius graeffei]|uniref:E3 ubiquitin-protein ligase TRIM21-like isoform X2 n=1 Tax=Neoarius graeffei TaxID=443677 RepID=UPI00298CC23E|nr:E3 ubiquitin-protein ligase TRIM21-like isoform X2 [Neoarius graeffei]
MSPVSVMASSSSVLSEDQLQCSICLNVFTDSVMSPCGHNFCMICLKEFWDSSSHCHCPVCQEEFPICPELHMNTSISELAAPFKKAVQTLLGKTQAEVKQMIQERLKKIEETKHSVELNKKNTEKEKANIVGTFSALMRCIERSQTELLKVMEEKQKAAEMQAEEFIKELEQEITELKRRNTELEQISHTEDHLHLLQIYPSLCSPPHTQDWTDVTINSHLSVETLRRALSQLQETLSEEMEKVPEIKLKRIQQYAVDVTLDPDTSNPYLILSDDGNQVKDADKRQNLPDNPERFNSCPCVLGKEGFSSGRFYYEVQVRGKTKWDLGIARESINRKGQITPSPKDGYWCVWLRDETEYKALDSPRVSLSLKQAPQKVGVFVDYEEGLISFYDVDTKSHIYSFIGQNFTEKLYPYFSPGLNDEGKNSAPLIICPVNQI